MNPAKDVEYPDPIDVPDEPVEPDVDEDSELPAEHALYARDSNTEGGPLEGGEPAVERGPLAEDVPDNESERLNGPRM